ncbi:MAG: peptide deformylase [Deltaproteobacteria bacterium]|jgi:peptide deformylase|nr:peptide deformylase [Deltaproteobacteria bacterium]
MGLEVLQYPDPRLKLKSAPVAEITPEIKKLAEDMAATMYEADGIGLAAPQVGRLLRMIVTDISGPAQQEALRVYINPELTPLPPLPGEEETQVSEEGCLSVPDYRSMVRRCSRVRLQALDLEGNPVLLEAAGLEAICLQHECDHLEGRLFLDHVSRLKRYLYDDKIKKGLIPIPD